MKLIVGLGNPGEEYDKTRHNIGFMVLDNYASLNDFEINKKKFNGWYYKTNIKNEDVIFLKPGMYMNLSGEVIKKYVDYFKIEIDDILIIHDDLDIQCGKFRLKEKGRSAGHNGIKNIISNLNTEQFKRLKIGIAPNNDIDTKNYVLGKISKAQMFEIDEVIKISKDIIDDFLILSFDELVNKYNRK